MASSSQLHAHRKMSPGLRSSFSGAPTTATTSLVSMAVQTESCFPPGTYTLIDQHYDKLASEQLQNLRHFRQLIQGGLVELARTTYDLIAYKDVMFKMEEMFGTGLPLTDLMLLASKLFRHTSEVSRQLACFFDVVFAEEYSDEHFHFVELRTVQRELVETRKALQEAERERDSLRATLGEVATISQKQSKTVDLLEQRNQAISLHKSALEDQLAILFHQVSASLDTKCGEDIHAVDHHMELHEELEGGRIAFNETMDSLAHKLRSSRLLVSEIRESLQGKGLLGGQSSPPGRKAGISPTGGGAGGGGFGEGIRGRKARAGAEAKESQEMSAEISQVRFKLKTLDANLQQLVGRFMAVKDQMASTAQEQHAALADRKRSLYMSLHHIRLYEVQNAKLRHARALFQDLRRRWAALIPRVEETIVNHDTVFIDQYGYFSWDVAAGAGNPKNSMDCTDTNGKRTTVQKMATTQRRPPPNLGSQVSISAVTDGGPAASSNFGVSLADISTVREHSSAGDRGPGEGSVVSMSAAMGGTFNPGASLGVSRSFAMSNCAPSHSTLPLLPRTGQPDNATMDVLLTMAPSWHAVVAFQRERKGLRPLPYSGDEQSQQRQVEPFPSLKELLEHVHEIGHLIGQLDSAYSMDDEHKGFLQLVSLAAATSARDDVDPDALINRLNTGALESALIPTGNRCGTTAAQGRGGHRGAVGSLIGRPGSCFKDGRVCSSGEHGSAEDGSAGEPGVDSRWRDGDQSRADNAAVDTYQQQLQTMHEEFATKLGLLRQVYEARIADLEVKESSFKQRLEGMKLSLVSEAASTTAVPKAAPSAAAGGKGLKRSQSPVGSRGGGGRGGKKTQKGGKTGTGTRKPELAPLRSAKSDRDALVDARMSYERVQHSGTADVAETATLSPMIADHMGTIERMQALDLDEEQFSGANFGNSVGGANSSQVDD